MELELRSRQDQFATLFRNVRPEQLRGLRFCRKCEGEDYQWTDWALTPLDMTFIDTELAEDSGEYRHHLATSLCLACAGTGFEGGRWEFSIKQWLELGNYSR